MIDKSEIAIRKYENGDVSIPFSVMFLVVHILKISKKEIEDFLDEIIKENTTFYNRGKRKMPKKNKSWYWKSFWKYNWRNWWRYRKQWIR